MKACPENTQAYSESGVTQHIQNPGIFKTLAYSEPVAYAETWHIHNRGIFKTLGYSESEANSEPYQASTMEHCAKLVNSNNFFHKL